VIALAPTLTCEYGAYERDVARIARSRNSSHGISTGELTSEQYTSHCVNNFLHTSVVVSDEVSTAINESRSVVALETTIVVHGLPAPINIEVARECETAVRASGAVPATIGVIDGRVVVGLTLDELMTLASDERHALKLSARDLGLAVASKANGATTVAGTIGVARRVGIEVMATGGLGGVHRDAAQSYDESADLTALSRYQVLVVASGVKSILDVGATLERMDTLGVPVIGFKTSRFPGFYQSNSGFGLDWRVDDEEAAAAAFLAHRVFSTTGVLVANPIDAARELSPELHERALASALEKANLLGVKGKDVTPVLLAEFARFTAGVSVQVNRDLVVANAGVAGRIAQAIARTRM
jgi:pseudouridine-5'-phosphate glycosidase